MMTCLGRCWWRNSLISRDRVLRPDSRKRFMSRLIRHGSKTSITWREGVRRDGVGQERLIRLCGWGLLTQKSERCGSGQTWRISMSFFSRFKRPATTLELCAYSKAYGYYIGKGIYCIVLARFLNLA